LAGALAANFGAGFAFGAFSTWAEFEPKKPKLS